MELFSEVYSCYYQVLRHLLSNCNPLTIEEIRSQIHREGFEESLLSIIPKLENGDWNLFQKEGNLYLSRLKSDFLTPVSNLEKSYLKALLADSRISLFLNPEQEEEILHEVEEELQMKLNGQGEILEPSKEGEPGILNGNTG